MINKIFKGVVGVIFVLILFSVVKGLVGKMNGKDPYLDSMNKVIAKYEETQHVSVVTTLSGSFKTDEPELIYENGNIKGYIGERYLISGSVSYVYTRSQFDAENNYFDLFINTSAIDPIRYGVELKGDNIVEYVQGDNRIETVTVEDGANESDFNHYLNDEIFTVLGSQKDATLLNEELLDSMRVVNDYQYRIKMRYEDFEDLYDLEVRSIFSSGRSGYTINDVVVNITFNEDYSGYTENYEVFGKIVISGQSIPMKVVVRVEVNVTDELEKIEYPSEEYLFVLPEDRDNVFGVVSPTSDVHGYLNSHVDNWVMLENPYNGTTGFRISVGEFQHFEYEVYDDQGNLLIENGEDVLLTKGTYYIKLSARVSREVTVSIRE